MAPSIELPLIFRGERGPGNVVTAIVQQKVKTISDAGGTAAIHKAFIDLNQRMWERGVLDIDPEWEPNYGLLPSGRLVLIDIGGLSDRAGDFPYYEGLPRRRLYETSLKSSFSQDNFRRFFRKNLEARSYAAAVVVRRVKSSRWVELG